MTCINISQTIKRKSPFKWTKSGKVELKLKSINFMKY